MQYKTNIDATRQVYSPSGGANMLRRPLPAKYQSKAATQHGQDVYRGQGQQAALDLSRNSQQAQNQYYLAAQRAQDQSVLGGLANLSQQQANRMSEAQQASTIRYRLLNDLFSGALGGLM